MIQYSNRKYLVNGLFILVILVIIGKLFHLQVINQSYKSSAYNNSMRVITQYPARGLIFDRNRQLLVSNKAAYDLLASPDQLGPFDTNKLCKLVEIEKNSLKENLKKAYKYSTRKPSVIVKQISAEDYAKLQEKLYQFPGFFVQPRTLRYYPENIASHVLGYVGEVGKRIVEAKPYYKQGDYIGMSGVEKEYEEHLRGEKGYKLFMVDVHNKIKGSYQQGKKDKTAVVGKNITLSIDARLQNYGEQLTKNNKGSIVAIEPSTGEILTFVSSPYYNPNLLVGRKRSANFNRLLKDSLKPLFNRPIMANYPPGSTFKTINALIGLEEGLIKPSTKFWCYNGYRSGRVFVGCHSHRVPLRLDGSIQCSCNSYYCNVLERILSTKSGETISEVFNKWKDYVISFGLGKKLNVDLPNEYKGNVPTAKFYNRYYGKNRWSYLTVISLAIGQGELLMTPLQLANQCAIIANRGYFYTPHVAKELQYEDLSKKYITKNYADVDTSNYKSVVEGMWLAVNGEPGSASTAGNARVKGLDICGKTGTAENPHGKDHSIFMAFAPRENPQIAIAVYVENGGYGSTWAAPIASLMIEEYLTDTVSRGWYEDHILNANLLNND